MKEGVMIKRMVIMLIATGIIFGGIFGYKMVKAKTTRSMTFEPPPVTVTAMTAALGHWQPELTAVGSLRAVRGVEVTSEIAGLVHAIKFLPGAEVQAGQVLVELNADADVARLHELEVSADLAQTTYDRDRKLFEAHAVSQAQFDTEAADLKNKRDQVEEQQAVVDRKTIRAPFAGRLGISTVNPGQYVNPGDRIVTLQALSTLLADFALPQQDLARVARGQEVTISVDTYPGQTFPGRIATVDPKVDPATRNFQVEALVANPKRELAPGMYATISLRTGATQSYLTLPQTAVVYNPYGDTVFIIEEQGKGPDGQPRLTAKQTFVTVGPVRGDQIAIITGIKEGDLVATTGQLKLKNGSPVVINNTVQPLNEAAPKPPDE
jgi:membrane fusion protein, multidrug efflux system